MRKDVRHRVVQRVVEVEDPRTRPHGVRRVRSGLHQRSRGSRALAASYEGADAFARHDFEQQRMLDAPVDDVARC